MSGVVSMRPGETFGYERHEGDRGPRLAWAAVLVFTALLLGRGLLTAWTVPDGERSWDVDALPDTPGASRYGIAPLPRGEPPRRQLGAPDDPALPPGLAPPAPPSTPPPAPGGDDPGR